MRRNPAPPATSAETAEQLLAVVPPFTARVREVSWERVHLAIRVELSQIGDWLPPEPAPGTEPSAPLAFQIVDNGRSYDVAFDDDGDGDGVYTLRINITTFQKRQGIPNGTWRIHPVVDGHRALPAVFDGRELAYLDEASRVFLYDGNRSVVTVSFGISENEIDLGRLDFLIRSYQLFRSSPKKRKSWHPIKRLRSSLLSDKRKKEYAGKIYRFVNRRIGVKQGRVLFASDQRLTIEGNLRRVQERMIERGLDKTYDLKYSFRLPRSGGWRTTIRILYLLATSEFVLLDDYFGLLKSVKMDPRTKVIQLWHAGSGFKSVGYSRFGNPGSPKLWHPHRQYTYAITGSEHLRHVYAEAFGIEEAAVIPTGLPRVDWFLDEDRRESFTETFYEEHPELVGKRIVLFAPTFRGRSIYTAFYDYDQIDFDGLYEACGEDTVVLFRMHHFVKQPIDIPEQYRDRFFDYTKFRDGLNLLHVTDLLITDYSSIIYEFSLLDRPMLFFAPDKVNYGATRGFHRDYDETAPGRVCTTFPEVIDAIRTGEFEQEKVATFRAENFDRIDTGAADRVIDWLILNPGRIGTDAVPSPEDERVEDAADTAEQEVSEEEIA
ncbi:CDP-glycerol glycerophosphotransferase family protein [Microbacterium sp. 179-B 1A2 NHS]|uniref:CDP-glycerol glycerophosphotransferase family protein n=1 Tax=Microbacterium sp. 179-B 1A2 NHS TaxID=3142383 RepID=UPI0039A15E25